MSLNNTSESNNFALAPRTPKAVEKAKPGAKRIMSGMVSDALTLAKVTEGAKAQARLDFTGRPPLGLCPNCGGKIFEAATDYLCERSQAESQACEFKIGKIVLQQHIELDQIRQLLATGKTDLLDRFVSKAGHMFSAYLVIESGKIRFAFPRRIVLVDDQPDSLQLMELLIKQWFKDAIVVKFQDGAEAWQELLRAEPDVLVTDLQRPSEMDGWKMISLLAEKKVKYPIVVVTGYSKGPDLDDKTPSDAVQDLLRRVRPTLNVTVLVKSFDNESFRMILEPLLKMQTDKPHAG